MTPTEIAHALKGIKYTSYEEHCELVDACDHYMLRTMADERAKNLHCDHARIYAYKLRDTKVNSEAT